MLMEVNQSVKDLEGEALCLVLRQWKVSAGAHVLFQIIFQVLENEPKLIARVNDFFKPDKKC